MCPKNVDPAGAIQRYKLTGAIESMEGVLPAEGGVMADIPAYTYHPRWLRRRVSTYWWLSRNGPTSRSVLREGSCLLRRPVRRLPASLIRRVLMGTRPTRNSSPGPRVQLVLLLNIVSFLFLILHAVTFFDAAPRALVVHVGKRRVPERLIGPSRLCRPWLVASALVFWLVLVR